MTLGEYSLLAVTSIFVIVDPIAAVPAFIAMTPNDAAPAKLRMARLACWVAAGVLMLFAATGKMIFNVMGITLPAFQLAGSILLLRIALDMLYARRSPAQETDEEVAAGAAKEDIAITPLGVPMLAGPGAISTVMVLVGQTAGLWRWEMGAILGSIALTSLASYWVLAGAGRVLKVLGETGIRVLVRVMGLLLVALAMQYFVNGLTDLGLIARP